jgi:GH18 family chitinase
MLHFWGLMGACNNFSNPSINRCGYRLGIPRVRTICNPNSSKTPTYDVDYSGNGEDYKLVPNKEKEWEIDAYPELLKALRNAVGPEKLLSAAVPGMARDMMGFTEKTVPAIMESLDFLNVMTYDLMIRRDNITTHHAGIEGSARAIDAYIERGAAPEDLNLGFAFYARWFHTEREACIENPIGCPTVLMEDPTMGADLGHAGAFAWADPVPDAVKDSFQKAVTDGQYDEVGGGYWYFDSSTEPPLWWSFETPESLTKKYALVAEKGINGVFAWELGGDGPEHKHLAALNNAVASASYYPKKRKEEL